MYFISGCLHNLEKIVWYLLGKVDKRRMMKINESILSMEKHGDLPRIIE